MSEGVHRSGIEDRRHTEGLHREAQDLRDAHASFLKVIIVGTVANFVASAVTAVVVALTWGARACAVFHALR